MTREELEKSFEYHMSCASTTYWRGHKDDKHNDNSQICDAFEAGALWAIEYLELNN